MRFYNFREGDRSEYLANYLVSGLGLVTPVPRQEDIGIDFYCSLADQEFGRLTFGFPYLLQVKSSSEKEITYGSLNKKNEWLRDDLLWLFRQELPLFIGIVYKNKMRIDIYNTSAFWFVHRENPNPNQLIFKPRFDFNDKGDVGRPKKIKLENLPKNSGDGFKYEIDLGLPIISITNKDFDDKAKIAQMKSALRAVIYIEQNNLVYKRLRLPYFNWILKSDINKGIIPAWIYYGTGREMTSALLRTIAPSLISLALNLKQCGDTVNLDIIKPLLKKLPKDMIYENLKKEHSDLFN